MIRLFKRSRPTPTPPKLAIEDLLVLRWYEFTLAEWDAMPAIAKADKREGFYQAQGLAS